MPVGRPVPVTVQDGSVRLFDMPAFAAEMSLLVPHLIDLARGPAASLVVTANVDHMLTLERCSDFAAAYQLAEVRTIDGAPLLALARILGLRGGHRNTGADLVHTLPPAAREAGLTLAFVGGAPGVAAQAADRLAARWPGLRAIGIELPVLDEPSDPTAQDAVDQLIQTGARIVFICLGAPKQELFFLAWRKLLPSGVYIGAGAAVDFAAGTAKRAPIGIQRAGLEWLWRLGHDPRRLAHRYLVKGPRFVLLVAKSLTARARRPNRH